MDRFDLERRVVMVTGGGSGIGRAVAIMAAASGARVAVVDASSAEDVAASIVEGGGQALAITADVRDRAAARSAVDLTVERLGDIDGLVTCAGVSRPQPAEVLDADLWDLVVDVNLTGTFNFVQAVGAGMVARGTGAIVTIGSVDSTGGHSGRIHYCATKHGVVGLTETAAIEWGHRGVRVNCVAPGCVDSPMLRSNIPPAYLQNVMLDRIPMGRLSTCEDQAAACLFLLSDAARYVTGTVLRVDGGLAAGYFNADNGRDYGQRK